MNTQTPPILCLKNIGKTYGNTKSLQGINITFYPGEVHAILGENGAGKTTLMKIISGVTAPTTGSISLHNTQIYFKKPYARP